MHFAKSSMLRNGSNCRDSSLRAEQYEQNIQVDFGKRKIRMNRSQVWSNVDKINCKKNLIFSFCV